jgi:hypothetical protein
MYQNFCLDSVMLDDAIYLLENTILKVGYDANLI